MRGSEKVVNPWIFIYYKIQFSYVLFLHKKIKYEKGEKL